MSTNQQYTNDEHFVSQGYYKGFSENEATFFAYNVIERKQHDKAFPIRSQCFQKHLYELRDENSEFFLRNHIENTLASIESEFLKKRNALVNKAHKENCKTKCFFTSEEKLFWKIFIGLQLLRTDSTLERTTEFIKKHFGEDLNNNIAKDFALFASFPFWGEDEEDFFSLFMNLMYMMKDMYICLFIDESESIFTTDNPVFIHAPKMAEGLIDLMVYPLLPGMVIILFGDAITKHNSQSKNCLVYFDDNTLDITRREIALSANNWVYSREPLSKKDIELINETRDNHDLVIKNYKPL